MLFFNNRSSSVITIILLSFFLTLTISTKEAQAGFFSNLFGRWRSRIEYRRQQRYNPYHHNENYNNNITNPNPQLPETTPAPIKPEVSDTEPPVPAEDAKLKPQLAKCTFNFEGKTINGICRRAPNAEGKTEDFPLHVDDEGKLYYRVDGKKKYAEDHIVAALREKYEEGNTLPENNAVVERFMAHNKPQPSTTPDADKTTVKQLPADNGSQHAGGSGGSNQDDQSGARSINRPVDPSPSKPDSTYAKLLSKFDRDQHPVTQTSIDEIRSLMDKASLARKMVCYTDPAKDANVEKYDKKEGLRTIDGEHTFDASLILVRDGVTGSGLPFAGIQGEIFFSTNGEDGKSKLVMPENSTLVRNIAAGRTDDLSLDVDRKVSRQPDDFPQLGSWDGSLVFYHHLNNNGRYRITTDDGNIVVCGVIPPAYLGGPIVGGAPYRYYTPACCLAKKGAALKSTEDSEVAKEHAEDQSKFQSSIPLRKKELSKLAKRERSTFFRCGLESNPDRRIFKHFGFKKGEDGKLSMASSETRTQWDDRNRGIYIGDERVEIDVAQDHAFYTLEKQKDSHVAKGVHKIPRTSHTDPETTFSFEESMELSKDKKSGDLLIKWTVNPQVPRRQETWICSEVKESKS